MPYVQASLIECMQTIPPSTQPGSAPIARAGLTWQQWQQRWNAKHAKLLIFHDGAQECQIAADLVWRWMRAAGPATITVALITDYHYTSNGAYGGIYHHVAPTAINVRATELITRPTPPTRAPMQSTAHFADRAGMITDRQRSSRAQRERLADLAEHAIRIAL